MTVVAKDVRKVVVLGWDTSIVIGKTASIQAEGKELRVVSNSGTANVFYPLDYTGSTDFTVVGSKGGSDTGTVEVTAESGSGSGEGGPEIPEAPPEVDNSLPEDQPEVDNELPEPDPPMVEHH